MPRILYPDVAFDRRVASTPSNLDAAKRAAAVAAVAEIEDGMTVGMGTGSTAMFATEALAASVRNGLRVTVVGTSIATEAMLTARGIAPLAGDGFAALDLAIDGVDEIDPQLRAIKGAGGAFLREKIVAQVAKRMIAIADDSKAVERLGGKPVPVEVAPFGVEAVKTELRRLGAEPELRTARTRPKITDQGNLILDCRFDSIDDPAALTAALDAVPGVLAHGLFAVEIDALYLGDVYGGAARYERTTSPADFPPRVAAQGATA